MNIRAAGHAGTGINIGGSGLKEAASLYNAQVIEEAVKQFWQDSAVYAKTKELHNRDKDFFFVFCTLTAGLASTRIRSLIGLRLQEKLPLYASCDLIIGPIGSGNVIPGWLLKVPSIVYGPAWLCRIAMKQEREVPQGGPFADFVPAGKMKSVGDEDYDFSCMEIMKILRSTLRIGA